MYETGHGVEKNEAEAVRWYRMAADQGDAAAQNNLGTMYREGRGTTLDHGAALEWYRKAADRAMHPLRPISVARTQ